MAKTTSTRSTYQKSVKRTKSSSLIMEPASGMMSAVVNPDIEAVWDLVKSKNETDFIDQIRKGLPNWVIQRLGIIMSITDDELSSIFHVSKRTLQRRKPAEALNPEQSERAIEMARLYTRGEEVFGDMDTFKSWMEKKVLALGDKKPKEFLDTSIGIGMLLDELGRIEHGVYS